MIFGYRYLKTAKDEDYRVKVILLMEYSSKLSVNILRSFTDLNGKCW